MKNKDAYYFSHDSNAQHDPKIQALRKDFGWRGYGIYWALIETLHEQEGGRLEKFPKLYEGLASKFGISVKALTKQIEAMLHDYALIQSDENFIWSERVLRNLENRRLKYEQKVKAGRLGGIRSGVSRKKMKRNESTLETNEQKESKGKEIKPNEKKASELSTFLTELSQNPAYKGIDLNREFGKMDAWLAQNPSRKKTKRFILYWLNQIELPLSGEINVSTKTKNNYRVVETADYNAERALRFGGSEEAKQTRVTEE